MSRFRTTLAGSQGSPTGIVVPDDVLTRTTVGTVDGLAAGDAIEVTVERDVVERAVEIPDDFAAALAARPTAGTAFAALAPSHRREHVRAIEAAKKPETRARRIAAAIEKLTP